MVDGSLNREQLAKQALEAMLRRNWPEALRRADTLRSRYPDDPRGYFHAGNALRLAGRLDEAEALLATASIRFRKNRAIAIGHARVAASRRDWPAALLRWDAVRKRFPNLPDGHIGAAEALRALGHPDAATTILDDAAAALTAARESGLDEESGLRAEIELASARRDWQMLRRSAQRLIAIEATAPAQTYLALARAAWNLKDLDEAERAADHALAAQPTLVEAAVIGAWVAAERGDGAKALSLYRTLVRLRPGNLRWSLSLVRLLNMLGEVKEAARELDRVVKRWPDNPLVDKVKFTHSLDTARLSDDATAAEAAAAVKVGATEPEFPNRTANAPGEVELRRPIIRAQTERDVIVSEAAGADTVVLVFTGISDTVGIPLPIFDRYLAALGVAAVYLKDFNRLLYLRGVQSLAADYDGTLAALRKILEGLQAKRVCAIGNSAGGFAAIRYGIELGASRIASFSGSTHHLRNAVAQFRWGPRMAWTRFRASLTPEMLDLKHFLQSRRYKSEIQLYYGEGEEFDKLQALHLEGVAGVTLYPIADYHKHHTVARLAEKDELRQALTVALGRSSEKLSTKDSAPAATAGA
jgi:tetratricopeptide (TPR) repeat protein